MTDTDGLTLQVLPALDGDADVVGDLAVRLRTELLELDVAAVEPLNEDTAPDRAKGLASLAGWLWVQLGSLNGLRAVIGTAGRWAARTDCVVEVSYGGDVLKVSGVTSEQQQKIVDDWLARHATSS